MLNFICLIADLVNVTMAICDLMKKLFFVLLMLLSDLCFPAQLGKKKYIVLHGIVKFVCQGFNTRRVWVQSRNDSLVWNCLTLSSVLNRKLEV